MWHNFSVVNFINFKYVILVGKETIGVKSNQPNEVLPPVASQKLLSRLSYDFIISRADQKKRICEEGVGVINNELPYICSHDI